MGKIEELKKQNPNFNINIIDIINDVYGKSKYTEMVINLIKNKYSKREGDGNYYSDIHRELIREFKVKPNKLIGKTVFELVNIIKVFSEYIGYNESKTIEKFIELNEKNLITQKDLTTYKTIEELELQISLSDLKIVDKELEKQVLKLMETDEWLVLKPLSYQASVKYGSGTKWCTASKNESDYYFRYSKRGILIYCINKKTGDKVAGFKNLDLSYEKETSFWTIIDLRTDSIDCDLPEDVMNIFKEEFKNTKKTNWELLSEDERNRQLIQMESLNKKYDSTEYLAEGQPTAELRVTRRGDIVLDEEIAVSVRRA
jgi:hypothetical protein